MKKTLFAFALFVFATLASPAYAQRTRPEGTPPFGYAQPRPTDADCVYPDCIILAPENGGELPGPEFPDPEIDSFWDMIVYWFMGN